MSTRRLLEAGVGKDAIRAAVRAGSLVRIRRGWYRSAGAPDAVVRAVAVGGALTCGSALRLQGVWMMPDTRLHVRVARGVAIDAAEDVVVHWSDRRQDHAFPMDGVGASLSFALRCLDLRAAVVATDSALNQRTLTPLDLASIRETARGRRVLALCDPAAESGLETLARLALRRLRVRVRTQVPIAGVAGRVDLLIGDRLVLELDGVAWHGRPGDFERDRRRDRRLVALGYAVMRASYSQVLGSWPEIEQQILAAVRRGAHLWPRHRIQIRRE